MDTKSKFFSPVSPAAGAWQRFAGRTPESESFYRNRWRSDKVVLDPRRELHGVVLLEDLRQGRSGNVGDAADRLSVNWGGYAAV